MSLIESARKIANNLREYSIRLVVTDIEAALRVAEAYGHFLWTNYIGILADSEFEKELSEPLTGLLKGRGRRAGSGTLHLMTTAYASGGHTRVVERLLEAGLGDGLASLDKVPESVLGRLPKHVKVFSGIRKESGIATILEILEVGLKFKIIILYIHPDDIYSAIAAILMARMGARVYMYNHADHAFSFGYGAAEKVLEISRYGWIKGVVRGIEHKQTFVGIPIPHFSLREERRPKKESIHMFMAGSAYKFLPWGDYSVPVFINHICKAWTDRPGWKVSICGPTGREKFWRGLNRQARRHVEFRGPLPHAEYSRLLLMSDCYVDSFPVGNGTGFVESVMQGVPSFGLDLFAGYSCAEALKSRSVQELIAELENYIEGRGSVACGLSEVREQVIREQSVEVCIERVSGSMESQTNVPLLSSLASMRCNEGTFESYWESNSKININLAMLTKLNLLQKIVLVKCWSGAYPYVSV